MTRLLNYTVIVILLLYFGKPLLVPMSFGLLLAIICYPSSKWLESKGWPKAASATTLILLIGAAFGALLWLLGYELSMLVANKSALAAKFNEYGTFIRTWFDVQFGIHIQFQNDLLSQLTSNLEQNIGSALSTVLTVATSSLVYFILIPIFGVLFLTHRSTFVQFLEVVVGETYRPRLRTILHQSLHSYFRFVKGTFIVYCIVGCLNSLGLLLLGIEHAILFGMIAAFMTIIPYVGIIISAALPISIAFLTKDSLWYPAGVVMIFTLVQYLEANIIFPKIVGYQLNLSTWAVLVTIIGGTIVWGISGMILFVPFAGILKIVSENIPELKPLNILLTRRQKE